MEVSEQDISLMLACDVAQSFSPYLTDAEKQTRSESSIVIIKPGTHSFSHLWGAEVMQSLKLKRL